MPETPYRLRPVPCFHDSRLLLTPRGEEFVLPDLFDLQRRPFFVSNPHECLARRFRFIARTLPSGWYVLVFDIPRPRTVRPVYVSDSIPDLATFLRDLDQVIVRATQTSRRGLQT